NRLNKFIEIDILFITSNGIFCIESKYVSTAIVGDMEDRMWSVCNAYGRNVVYNPFLQNLEHIRCLKKYLRLGGYSTNLIHNVIVVPDKATIKSDCPQIKNSKDWLFEIAGDLYEDKELINVERVFKILEMYEVI
ncbi:nuclease-related domain-containing protein, partial [Paraclostridium bifermentans]|uniref:nuclease-related domain-containing protein n=1 Tax=Paraclostridium bifermentans TaxID=1490 RepID=UPI00374F1A00